MERLTLSTNIRTVLFGGQQSEQFSALLLGLGNGERAIDLKDKVDMRPIGTVVGSVLELMVMVFPEIQTSYKNHNWLCERAWVMEKEQLT